MKNTQNKFSFSFFFLFLLIVFSRSFIILSELDLDHDPRCVLPEVELSLASNVLKVQTTLSKMIIHADYSLIRNKSDIIYEQKDQDPLKLSPFLFEQVQDVGAVAISMEGCILSGFLITTLNGESVNLGYDHFRFSNCKYTVEIYRAGEDSPPVIAQYELDRAHGLSLTHLLMKPLITNELVPKLQAAMFSFVNTSVLFGKALQEYRENQVVFQSASQYFAVLIRNLNSITVEKNHGAIDMKDYTVYWADGRVRGKFKLKTGWSHTFNFAVEINDMVVDLQMGELLREEGRRGKQSKREPVGFKRLEVIGLRRMVFMTPKLVFEWAESLVTGYLISEVPKLLRSHLSAIFSAAIQKSKIYKRPDSPDNKNILDEDSAETDPKSGSNIDYHYSAETDPKAKSSLTDDDNYNDAYSESEDVDSED